MDPVYMTMIKNLSNKCHETVQCIYMTNQMQESALVALTATLGCAVKPAHLLAKWFRTQGDLN